MPVSAQLWSVLLDSSGVKSPTLAAPYGAPISCLGGGRSIQLSYRGI